MTELFFDLHVGHHFIERHMARPLDHHLHICGPRTLGQLTQDDQFLNLGCISGIMQTAWTQAIAEAVDRGATLAPARGSYTGLNKEMLYCACSNNEVFRVRNAVYSIDPKAIIMICEANEVFGEGFKEPGVG